MENQEVISGTGISEVIIKDPIPPAPDADEKKSDIPAATDDNAKAEETPEQQEAKKQSRRAAKREREIAAKAALETENRMLREQLARTAPKEPAAAAESGEPKREQFEDYEKYLEARADWRADQRVEAKLKAEREASQGREKQAKDSIASETTAKAWAEREKAFIATTKDYEEVVGAFVEDGLDSFSKGARELIVESELGPQLLHHLGTHDDVAERIAKLSPNRQIVELGKLEDSLAPQSEQQAAPKKVSSAPAPIKPVGQGRGSTNGYHDNMSDAEYKEWRSKNGARWARH